MTKTPLLPLQTTHLFPVMRQELLAVLHSLTDAEWQLPTACAGWSVKDVALHIWGDDLGNLSGKRDHEGVYFSPENFAELVVLINAHNDRWIQAARRISRKVLLDMLAVTGEQVSMFMASLDPNIESSPLGWAGNQAAPMGLQIAREFTEYWMHHQHICEAVGRDSLKEAHFMYPVLATFAHALPHTLSAIAAPLETCVRLVVQDIAAEWDVVREVEGWQLYAYTDLPPTSTVEMNAATAWHLFTKGISSEQARQQSVIAGDPTLGAQVFQAVAIIA
jgi:uncharacterized protein (TIGR03083 family)